MYVFQSSNKDVFVSVETLWHPISSSKTKSPKTPGWTKPEGLTTAVYAPENQPIGSMYGIFTYIYHTNQPLK